MNALRVEQILKCFPSTVNGWLLEYFFVNVNFNNVSTLILHLAALFQCGFSQKGSTYVFILNNFTVT